MEHLTKEEGIKKMQEEEGNTNHVMEYAERLRKMIKEKTLTREGRWKDRNETNMKKDANKTKDVELHVEGEVVVENSKKNGEDRNEVSDGSNKIISVNKSLRRTCWYYKRRTCKYGSGCKDLHPPACKNIKEYGECSDNSCKLLHQQVCRDHFNQGYCSRSYCWFIHPSKIGQRNQARMSTNMPS